MADPDTAFRRNGTAVSRIAATVLLFCKIHGNLHEFYNSAFLEHLLTSVITVRSVTQARKWCTFADLLCFARVLFCFYQLSPRWHPVFFLECRLQAGKWVHSTAV